MRPPPTQTNTPVLRNPFVLGGLAAVVAVLLVIVAVVAFSGDGGSGSGQDSAAKPATKTPTPEQVAGGDGVTGKANATVNVRNGPVNTAEVLGVLRRGGEVSVDGKSADDEWLQIVYPPRSKLHGWVLASSLDLNSDISGLAVATPEEIPLAVVPTSIAVATVESTPTPTPGLTATVTATPLSTLPDLVISGSLVSGAALVVTVTNQGTGTLTATAIEIGVFDDAGAKLLNLTTSAPQTLKPGASVDIRTGYLTLGAQAQVLAVVDPNGKIPETNDTNNRLVVTLGNGTPTVAPTATRTAKVTATATPSHP
jgi:hypothetical protein